MSSLLSREGGTQDVSAKQMVLGMALIVMSQVLHLHDLPAWHNSNLLQLLGNVACHCKYKE